MASKSIFLTLPEPLFTLLKREKEKFGYSSMQEIILSSIRERYFEKKMEKEEKETRGRPKKIDETAMMSRKRIFSKRGEPIPF